jgi:hypothetical protein
MILTKIELSKLVEQWYLSKSDEYLHDKLLRNDITFEEYVLSNLPDGKSVEIDYNKYCYRIV